MNLLLLATDPLQPYARRLSSALPHNIDIVSPACRLQEQLTAAHGYDAIILADGADALRGDSLTAGRLPLVIPRVHNGMALLLGGADAYRAFFTRYDGGICWMPAESAHPVYAAPPADCACLCCLADMQLGIPDNSLAARAAARENGWDFFLAESDMTLLLRLLSGDWDSDDILVLPAGKTARLTFRNDLLA